MDLLQAVLLGLIQGLTEFLPVSSSGHIELGKALFGIEGEVTLAFTIVVHGATVLSTLVVFRKDILGLFRGALKFEWNNETQYVAKLLVSMIPVAIVGIFFKDLVEAFFGDGNVAFVGFMLLITSFLLFLTYFYKPNKYKTGEVTFVKALVVGIAQAFAVLPGISRSGSTIATGLLLGIDKEKITMFSFLMVIIPILGENFLELIKGYSSFSSNVDTLSLFAGFLSAFLSGLFACKLMIKIVKNSKLIYFAIYTLIVGVVAILVA